ncbi:SusC/RagA family TonB-linked outer membrane protein [Chitinophagaceae bacterium LB-8]|uniref:SusC/RagA family TonB-linked outer membrane protein n=1 Tax=Paraflavisolibacter caeni TaxID=2982496 RepID=A0A9X2Y040_9BACT|nr:SusC/RagA family TonB-linked outer membrane protein [Paraflavisolibacter caeni]MCU7550653.1 SusC/RagA family TonB-linked outer membrane protein [Paraflavisolibacter caeni]
MKLIIATAFVLVTGTLAAQKLPAADTIAVKHSSGNELHVSGKIIDEASKKPVAGVRVQVENFSAAITDENGKYTLKVPSYKSTIMVSGEGMDTKYVPLKGRKKVDVSLLDETHESIYETVTMPGGLQSKKDVTAAIGQYSVSGWQQITEVPDAMLQGRIAGLNAIRRTGTPGAGANLFLRGFNSLYATNKPLIIIDNMLYDANDYGQSIIAGNYTNPLSMIDVKDIDNVTVLKDASSIYGTKGANGAIIITTLRAKEQATKIDFGAYTGFNAAPDQLPVMNASDYRTYLSEVLQSKGMSSSDIAAQPYMNDDPNNPSYSTYHFNTNWQNKVLANSMTNNMFLKVTGGDNIATYGLSVGYMKNEGVVKSTDLTRYNMRFNADFNFSKRFTGSANISMAKNEQSLKDQGIADKTSPVFLALTKAPFLYDHVVNSKGVESPNLSDVDTLGVSNPSAIIANMQAYNKYYSFFGSFIFKYDISKYLSAKTMIGINFNKIRENIFVPSKGVAKDTLRNAVANNRMGTQVKRLFSLYNDTRLEYNRTFSLEHTLSARLGVRYQNNDAQQHYALGYNSATDELVTVQNGLAALRQVGGGLGEWNWVNSYLGADYGFRSKYFFSVSAAMDGSSRFGKLAKEGIEINGYKFAVLPSVGAAWLISSENFMANSKINLLKLRATYSMTGNDDIGNYSSRQTYSQQNLLGMQGLVRNGIANPALQWETGNKLNGGLDIALLNERVSLNLDGYISKTENMLVYESLAASTGFATVLTNNGSMKNAGLEATLNARVINKQKLKWDIGVNAGMYKNEIVAVPNGQFTTEYAGATILTANEQPANQFYGYTTQGVFATSAEAATANLRKKNADGSYSAFGAGDIRFADLNGDHIIDENDRSVIGDPNPDFTGGLTNRVIWKNFELNALITFSQGNDIYNYVRYRLESMSGVQNQLEYAKNRWRSEGQVTNTPKATWGDPLGNSRFSDRWIEDGSYARLRTVSLQYYISVKSNIVNSATIYATGNNLLTLTKYKGYDPEFNASSSVFAQGVDVGMDPQFKSVTLGVRIGL